MSVNTQNTAEIKQDFYVVIHTDILNFTFN